MTQEMLAQGPGRACALVPSASYGLQQGPTFVGPEALTIRLSQVLQALSHRAVAFVARPAERSAAEWGKARAENHTGIDQICVLDDTFAQTRDALVHQD